MACPRGISWTHGRKNQQDKNGVARSACVHCHTTLTLPDLVPLLSWLFLRGKCRHCGKFIGWRYPLMEGLTLLGCIGIYIVWGFHPGAFILMAAVSILVALLFIDLEHMILPDQLNAILAGLAILLILYHLGAYGLSYGFGDKAISKVMGAALYGGLAWGTGWGVGKILKKNALGFGDVKFFAVAGLWLGWAYLPYFFAGIRCDWGDLWRGL
ncbi:MAG: prepilin peptidase [Rhodospirillales bacterium]|nr:prepilin peptidase [Rhodospirillales bacterium]